MFVDKCLLCIFLLLFGLTGYGSNEAAERIEIDQQGTVVVPSYTLPFSEHLSADSLAEFLADTKRWEEIGKGCLPANHDNRKLAKEACWDKHSGDLVNKQLARYSVSIESGEIAGVYVHRVLPTEGIAKNHRDKVLINISSGAALDSGIGRDFGLVESIPIAAVANMEVVTVNLRLDKESRFPEASEKVGKIYRQLLQSYTAENIGVYGCSFGGLLSSQFIAWQQQQHLPRPGALGLFCIGATELTGDSSYYGAAMEARPAKNRIINQYFSDADRSSPYFFPASSSDVISKFPPTLLLSSTRDHLLSSVVVTHRALLKNNVTTELHIWEGLRHGFFYNPDFPESREAYAEVARFFHDNLGRSAGVGGKE